MKIAGERSAPGSGHIHSRHHPFLCCRTSPILSALRGACGLPVMHQQPSVPPGDGGSLAYDRRVRLGSGLEFTSNAHRQLCEIQRRRGTEAQRHRDWSSSAARAMRGGFNPRLDPKAYQLVEDAEQRVHCVCE